MIMGIGVDTVNIERFERIVTETPAFVRRVFTPNERTRNIRSQAVRFAAKEALSKALGTGIREPVSLRHISIVHNDLGRPEFACAPELQAWLEQRYICRLHLSLSDEAEYIQAFAVAEM